MKLKKFLRMAVDVPYITLYQRGNIIGQGLKEDILAQGFGEEKVNRFHIYTVEHNGSSVEALTAIEVK